MVSSDELFVLNYPSVMFPQLNYLNLINIYFFDICIYRYMQRNL